MKQLNMFDWTALVLVIIGGLYWGLIGFLNFDILLTLFGKTSLISRMIYALVGIAALYLIFAIPMFGRRR